MSFPTQTKEINRKSISIQTVPEFFGQNAQYKIEKNNIISEYTSDIVSTYIVVQTNASHVNIELCALVLKVPQILDLSKFLSLIKLGNLHYINNIIDYGVINLDGVEHFTIIVSYLKSDNLLKNHLQLFKGQSEIILQQIIIPLLETLVQLHGTNITHGCINFDNIWIDSNNNIIVSNTILDLCGYNQHTTFEAPNRALVHRAGKSHHNHCADTYAVGVLLLALFAGETALKGGYEAIATTQARDGSYKVIIDQWFNGDDSILDSAVKHAAYWLLHSDETKRWNAMTALKFLRRRHRKITLSNIIAATSIEKIARVNSKWNMPLIFLKAPCYGPTEAAVHAIQYYEDMKFKVKNGHLINALLQNKCIKANFIAKVSILREVANKYRFGRQDETFLTLFILLFDNQMPIKIRDLSAEILGIWTMLPYVMHKKVPQISYTLQTFLSSGNIGEIYNVLIQICGAKINQAIHLDIHQLSYKLNELKEFDLSENTISYFIVSYMNSHSIYTHQVIGNKLCFNNDDALNILNNLNELDFYEAISDDNLIFSILGKLCRENNNFKLQDNILNCNIKDNKVLRALYILSYIQKNNYQPLHNIAKNLYEKIATELIYLIKNFILLSQTKDKLSKAVKIGDLSMMLRILQSKKIIKQQEKYLEIVKRVDNLHEQLKECNDYIHNDAQISKTARNITVKVATSILISTMMFICYQLFWI